MADERDDEVGERLRIARRRKGWSQALLSHNSGVPHSSICLYETAKCRASSHRLLELAQTLGVSVDWLLARPGAPMLFRGDGLREVDEAREGV